MVNVLELLLRHQRSVSYRRAITNERPRGRRRTLEPEEIYARVRRELGTGPSLLAFGAAPDQDLVRVDRRIAFMSALVIGATGSGKTRFLIGLLLECMREGLAISEGSRNPAEFELLDPKGETFTLLAEYLAALWLQSDARGRERIAEAVSVIEWSRDAVTPFAPLDNASGQVSNSYFAFLKTDVAIQTSPQQFSESLRQAYFMLNRLLVDRRYPPNYRFTAKLFDEEKFRRRVLEAVSDADVREYFLSLDHTVPRQTREALLRRIHSDMSFPEVRLSIGIAPDDLDRILPKRRPSIVIGNYRSALALPLAKAKERASYRLIDLLLAAPRRDTSRPELVVIEESPMLLAGSSELTEPLCEAARTLRSVGVGLWFVAQDFANALPGTMVRTLQLNTRWWSVFQSREEADWIYPHAVIDSGDREISDRERRRVFARRMQGLARQHFYLLVKGFPALPLVAVAVDDPKDVAGRSSEELREIFAREIASRSRIPAATAADLIARWEAKVVDGTGTDRMPSLRGAQPRARGLGELLRQLDVEDDRE